jgi:hypothetical protein
VANAFSADQQIGQFADTVAGASQHHHFETRVMIQMRMRRGNHDIVVTMLDIHQLDREHAEMVIVDERHRADHRGIRLFDGCTDQLLSNEITERLRSVRLALLLDEAVKPVEKIGVDSYADPAKFRHTLSQ